jgi:hypothetical protein
VPFRAKGIPTGLQIENYNNGEKNAYYHQPGDSVAHMNLDYWLEQMKATAAIAAHLAGPVTNCYLPFNLKNP